MSTHKIQMNELVTAIVVVYRRITLSLILGTAIIFCFEISVNPTVFNMAYNVGRKWASLAGNESSVDLKITKPSTVLLENIPNPFKTVDDVERATPKVTTANTINTSTETEQVQNVTRIRNDQIFAAHRASNKTHENEKNRLRIANGRFKVQDLMTVGPFQFLKNYKNPCWVKAIGNKTELAIRCLPYFYLIGAPKAGTTDLHTRLVQHPDISRLVKKETFWITSHYYSPKRRSSFEVYTNFFTYATREIILNRDADDYHNRVFGDCSATTMWHNDYWTILPQFRNLSEPKYTNADYIHHLNPKTKIIAMLRNPVDRLYSDYLFFQHGSREMFHEGVVELINVTQECLNRYTLRMCLYTPQSFYTDVKLVRLRIGVYHLHLKEFLRVFPRDQVMVIKLEDFSKRTVWYMQKIFAFLELPEVEAKDLQKIANPEKHANTRSAKDKKTGDMLPQTRRILQEFYRPHNDLLTELLGDQFDYNSDSVN